MPLEREWSHRLEPYPPYAGSWCGCHVRRPNVSLSWPGRAGSRREGPFGFFPVDGVPVPFGLGGFGEGLAGTQTAGSFGSLAADGVAVAVGLAVFGEVFEAFDRLEAEAPQERQGRIAQGASAAGRGRQAVLKAIQENRMTLTQTGSN